VSNDYHGRYLTPAGGWPVGPAEEPPAPIPARPYTSPEVPKGEVPQANGFFAGREGTPTLGDVAPELRSIPAELSGPERVVDFTKPGFGIVSIEEARSWGIEPPPAVVLADLLARLGEQLDDADFTAAHDSVRPEIADALQAAADEDLIGSTVVNLNDLAATDPAAFYRALDTEIAKAAAAIPPGYDIAVSCEQEGNPFVSNRVAFKVTGTPPKFTLDDFVDTLQRTLPPPETVKLTVEQMLAVRSHAAPRETWEPERTIWNIPIEIVETVEESTFYQWRHATPSPLRFDRELTEATLDDLVEMMKTPGKFIEFAAPRMGITQPIADLHRAVVIAEVTAAPEPRRSIVDRIWQRLRRWAR